MSCLETTGFRDSGDLCFWVYGYECFRDFGD